MTGLILLIKYALLYGAVLLLVAMGGMWSEHSGVINIALEGIMTIGAVAGALILCLMANQPPALMVITSILVACAAGVVYSALLAFASINLKADQTIGGT